MMGKKIKVFKKKEKEELQPCWQSELMTTAPTGWQ
jgi:hypothetical protein